jgi:6-phosphogluconate dehydrogenase
MQLGMIGLGRTGVNLTRRLMRDGHEVVVFDVNAGSVRQFVARLDAARTAWIMVPAGFVQETAHRLAELFDAGDVIIDGGNSYYRDDIDRWRALAPKGIYFVDVGRSGGVFGIERPPAVERYAPGSWGPDSVNQLIAPRRWHLPQDGR